MKSTISTLKERVARLEANMTNICDSLHEIKTNDLVHLSNKVDNLNERFNVLDKKVEGLAVKVGVFVAALTTLAQTVINYLLR